MKIREGNQITNLSFHGNDKPKAASPDKRSQEMEVFLKTPLENTGLDDDQFEHKVESEKDKQLTASPAKTESSSGKMQMSHDVPVVPPRKESDWDRYRKKLEKKHESANKLAHERAQKLAQGEIKEKKELAKELAMVLANKRGYVDSPLRHSFTADDLIKEQSKPVKAERKRPPSPINPWQLSSLSLPTDSGSYSAEIYD